MLDIHTLLQQAAAEAVKDHYDVEIDPSQLNVQETRKDFEGDFTLVVFPLTKYKLGAPPQIGEALGKLLVERLEYLKSYNVIKGFVNFTLTDKFWRDFLVDANRKPNKFFRLNHGKGTKVVVEYCSPNTNKPLHLGHLRNIILGYALTEVMKANGYDVHPVCLFNDRGTAISKSMYSWLEAGKNETPKSTGMKGDLLVGKYYVDYSQQNKAEVKALVEKGMSEEEAKKEAPSEKAIQDLLLKWEANDPGVRKLWETMNGWVYAAYEDTFKRLGVAFEKYYYESNLYQMGKDTVMEGLDQGAFYQKEDKSVWVDLTDKGLDHKLLLRSNGTSVYMTQDIATAEVRYSDYEMDKHIYVVGNEQDYHFKVLFLVMDKLEKPFADGMHHLSYGMVELPQGRGKIKSREGKAVDADDMMDEMVATARNITQELGKTEGMTEADLESLYAILGIGALKYFLVKVDPNKRIIFDPDESIDIHGHTGPFIQYAYTRTAAIRRKANEVKTFDKRMKPEQALHESERTLLRRIYHYPMILKEAGESYNPSLLANFAFELAKDYNRFYHGDKIINSDHPKTSSFRMMLSNFSGQVIREAMALLGIDMPERM